MSFSSILETAQWVFQIVKLNSSIQEHHIVFLTANHSIIRNILVTFVLIALSYFFLRNNQNTKTNWAVFYASLYMVVMLFFTNYMCADLGLWQFTVSKIPSLHIPPDLYFIWIFFWGVLPVLFFKGRHLFLIAISLFWIDICTMPVLQDIGLIKFNSYWILGELSLIAIVFVPGYFWAYCSYNNKYLGLRSILQVITIGTATILGIPLLLNAYGLLPNLSFEWSSIEFQILFIVVFPALAAVNDLVTKGDGTPFPFDPTKKLVRTGVYAYCKNPIQWSYTLLFIVLSISYSSFYFLIGFIVSILFVIGISDFHEGSDMDTRFGEEWLTYKSIVPKWMFLWKPKDIPKGVVYFKLNCSQCEQFRTWFLKSNAVNLDIKFDTDYPGNKLTQVTYIDHNGMEFKSVTAISCCFDHINLAYASLGWFMRFPVLHYLLQVIVDSMEFESVKEKTKR